MKDDFVDVVKKAIGKPVNLQILIADNPPYSVDGILEEVNEEVIVIYDPTTKARFYVNAKISGIAALEVFGEESRIE